MRAKRGFFGWMFLLLFLGFQAVMALLVWANVTAVVDVTADCAGEIACQAGAATGSAMVAAVGWMVWLLGTVILGFLVLMTRGRQGS